MKKISLKNLHVQETEFLSREQLKNVLGGYAGGTGTSPGDTTTTCAPDDPTCTSDDGGSTGTGGCSIAGGIHGGSLGTSMVGVCENRAPWDSSYVGEFCVLRQGNNVIAYNFGCIPA